MMIDAFDDVKTVSPQICQVVDSDDRVVVAAHTSHAIRTHEISGAIGRRPQSIWQTMRLSEILLGVALGTARTLSVDPDRTGRS